LAIGIGLGKYVGFIDNIPYAQYLAAGIIIPPAMYTASFECSFGTFIRMEFDKVYDGMLSSSINVKDLFIGEILFAGTKSLFFSTAVLIVVSLFGLIPTPIAIFAPFIGMLTGLMFAPLSLFITSFVKTINHFNFYFTGLLTPMFFFSGIVFPLNDLPSYLKTIAYIFPLAHAAKWVRAIVFNQFSFDLIWSFLYILGFILFFSFISISRLSKRMIN
jgi:lipooligosaccharide transport system permease protein